MDLIRTLEAVIDSQGHVRLLEDVRLSEWVLGSDWSRPEEAAAWSHLQPA